jgi:hypothetical protein
MPLEPRVLSVNGVAKTGVIVWRLWQIATDEHFRNLVPFQWFKSAHVNLARDFTRGKFVTHEFSTMFFVVCHFILPNLNLSRAYSRNPLPPNARLAAGRLGVMAWFLRSQTVIQSARRTPA